MLVQDVDFRGFYSKILINILKKQIPGDGRKSGGASAPPAPPSLAPMMMNDVSRSYNLLEINPFKNIGHDLWSGSKAMKIIKNIHLFLFKNMANFEIFLLTFSSSNLQLEVVK